MHAQPSTPFRRAAAGFLLAATLLGTAGCGGEVVAGHAVPDSRRAVAQATGSSSAAERLQAAVNDLYEGGTVRITTTDGDSKIVSHVDYRAGAAVLEEFERATGKRTMTTVVADNDIAVRLDERDGDIEAHKWYRPSNSRTTAQAVAITFDPEWTRTMLECATRVVDQGPKLVGDTPTTLIRVELDTGQVYDRLVALLSDGATTPDDGKRAERADQLPDSIRFWVDEEGRVVKEDDGTGVKVYDNFGAPITFPQIDNASIEPLPVG